MPDRYDKQIIEAIGDADKTLRKQWEFSERAKLESRRMAQERSSQGRTEPSR